MNHSIAKSQTSKLGNDFGQEKNLDPGVRYRQNNGKIREWDHGFLLEL